jgi:hypothetical protein
MRIFIGTEEIASILAELAEGFRESGNTVTTYVTVKNKFYDNNHYNIIRGDLFNSVFKYSSWKFLPDKVLRLITAIDKGITKPYLLIRNKKIIREHDVFIFIWQPWVKESVLFPMLKKMNKKIICIHTGSDVRHISAFEQEYNIDTSGWEPYFHNDSVEDKIKKIRYQELYTNLIYSVPDQAGLLLRNYNHLHLPLSSAKKIVFNIPARKIPLIIHAPSRSGIKGTDIIISAVNRLKEEGHQFEFRLIQNMPNEELLKLLTDADILCDELYLHGPGVLGIEAMAAGCTVATRCLNIPPFQPPVCPVTPADVYEKLKKLVTDIDYRVSLAAAAKLFVDQNNDPRNIAKKMLIDLANENGASDYQPRFFIKKYELPAGTELSGKIKSLTKQVAEKYNLQDECEQYKLKTRGLI